MWPTRPHHCRVAVYNFGNKEHQQWENTSTYDWYQDQNQHQDQGWYNQDWIHQGCDQESRDINNQQHCLVTTTYINNTDRSGTIHQCNGRHPHSNSHQQQMIDSAAATHLCPPWFGTSLLPLHAHHWEVLSVYVCACLAGLLWALQLSNLHSQQTSHLSQGFACCVCTSNSAAKELRKSKRSCFFR